jgi:hypothetical protein
MDLQFVVVMRRRMIRQRQAFGKGGIVFHMSTPMALRHGKTSKSSSWTPAGSVG